MNIKQMSLFSLIFIAIITSPKMNAQIDTSYFHTLLFEMEKQELAAWHARAEALHQLEQTEKGKLMRQAFNKCASAGNCGTDILFQQAVINLEITPEYKNGFWPVEENALYFSNMVRGLTVILTTHKKNNNSSFNELRSAIQSNLYGQSELTAPKAEEKQAIDRASNKLINLINAEEEKYLQQIASIKISQPQ